MTDPLPTDLAPHFPELAGRWGSIPATYRGNAVAMLQLLEAVRAAGGSVPLTVTSWYRAPLTNLLAGGVSKSQHLTASAADIVPATENMMTYFRRLAQYLPPQDFGQLIYERNHIHVSLPNRANGRTGEVLIEASEGHYVTLAGYATPKPDDAESGERNPVVWGIGLLTAFVGVLILLGAIV